MPFLENKATELCAVNVCNKYNLKREILCASGSYYDLDIKKPNSKSRLDVWIDMVEKTTTEELKSLPVIMIKKVMELVFPIGMSMLTWAVYHERIIKFSRDFSIDALDSSCFTHQGLLDNKTIAGKLMEEKSLNIQEKYKLACLYCFEDNIKDLYGKLTPEDLLIVLFDGKGLTEFWTHYLSGDADKFRGRKTMDEYRLEKAVESGSKAGVEYSWNIIRSSDSNLKGEYIRRAAMNAVRCSVRDERNDLTIFHPDGRLGSWVPCTYYIDIMLFLLSEMTDDQKREFLRIDVDFGNTPLHTQRSERSRVLDCLLSCPYQVHFMETARLMWEFLPEANYAELLLTICHYIGLGSRRDMLHGEGNFDYRKLFQEFWEESPRRYKEYVFSNAKVECRKTGLDERKAGIGLLSRLLNLHSYSARDTEAIKLILSDASNEKKEEFISDKNMGYTCIALANEKKFERLNALLQCFASIVDVNKFKNEFFCDWKGQRVFSASLHFDEWEAFKEFAKWCALPEQMLKQCKEELIKSEFVVFQFLDFVLTKRKMNFADEVLMWCFSSEEEIEMYKKDLTFLHASKLGYKNFLSQEEANLMDEFHKWCLSSEEEIKRLKKKVVIERGISVCRELFYRCFLLKFVYFEHDPWKILGIFLNWCKLSDEEISEFKKNTVLGNLGGRIFSILIQSNLEEDANNFFAWLNVSTPVINTFKLETLQEHVHRLMCRAEKCNDEYVALRKRVRDAQRSAPVSCPGFVWCRTDTELHIKFCLTDKEAVIKFKNIFEEDFASRNILPFQKAVLEAFWKMVRDVFPL